MAIPLTAEDIKDAYQDHQNNLRIIQENEYYVKGKNPDTLNKKSEGKPDNRITIPMAKMAVETLCGYAGRAGDIQINFETMAAAEESTETESEQDEYIDIQRKIAEFNEEPLETSELYQEALTQGEAYELFWVTPDTVNEDAPLSITPEYKIIKRKEGHVIISSDIKPKVEAFLRFTETKTQYIADAYYPGNSERWTKQKKAGAQETETWVRNREGDTIYPYTDVPVAVYPINSDRDSLFEAEKDLITGNDKLLNKSINEVDRFNALITLFPGKLSKELKDKMDEIKMMDELEDFERWPEYLQKNLSGVNEFYKDVADRLERLFHKSSKIVDFTDEDFVNAQSGIALAYKLIGMEFVASKIDTYFYKGLKQRDRLINQALKDNNIDGSEYKMKIMAQRNLPVDVKAKVEIAQMLIGLVSEETLLRILPQSIVDDVKKEQERIANEGPSETIPGLNGEGNNTIPQGE